MKHVVRFNIEAFGEVEIDHEVPNEIIISRINEILKGTIGEVDGLRTKILFIEHNGEMIFEDK